MGSNLPMKPLDMDFTFECDCGLIRWGNIKNMENEMRAHILHLVGNHNMKICKTRGVRYG